jgi:hypothetical protein
VNRYNSIKRCVRCLYRVGFGFTAIERKTGTNKGLISKWVKDIKRSWRPTSRPGRSQLPRRVRARQQRKKRIQGPKRLNPTEIIVSALAFEARSLEKFDERNHWWFHPIRVRWSSAKTARGVHRRARSNRSNYYLSKLLRSRINRVLKGTLKSAPTLTPLGASLTAFRKHIESKWRKGWNWGNYGTLWEIDHRIPCSAFNLSDRREQERCFHFTNLQPLAKKANRRKSSRLEDPQQSLTL